MRRLVNVSLALACICSWSISAALAGEPGCSKDKAKSAACMASCSGSPAGFPAMVMTVNGKKFDCCIAAGKAAKEANAKVVYMVGDQKFDCQDSAMVALADASEQFVDRYLSVAYVADGKVMYTKDSGCCSGHATMAKADGPSCHGDKAMAKSDGATCPHAAKGETAMVKSDSKGEGSSCAHAGAMAKGEGCCHGGGDKAMAMVMSQKDIDACCKNAKEVKYIVCGRTFNCPIEANKAREKTLEALKNVKMTYVVDGKEVDCSTKVCPVAKKEGKVVYVVGSEKMKCEFQARVALAKAKYEAARDTAEKLAKI